MAEFRSVSTATPDPRAPSPKGNAWNLVLCFKIDGVIIHRWESGPIVACASFHSDNSRHVSISIDGWRASDDVVRSVLADFDLEGAEEDNHSSGRARHFWLDRGVKVQPECPCKSTEETIVEPDGYRWQRPKGGD